MNSVTNGQSTTIIPWAIFPLLISDELVSTRVPHSPSLSGIKDREGKVIGAIATARGFVEQL